MFLCPLSDAGVPEIESYGEVASKVILNRDREAGVGRRRIELIRVRMDRR